MNRSPTANAIELASRKIRQMRIDYERFFNGAIEVPPDDLVQTIRSDLKRLRNAGQISTAESFRLSNIEAEFNAYVEMFQRRVRQRELGGVRVAAPPAPPLDPRQGVTLDGSLDDRTVTAIYQSLSRQEQGPKFELESFRSYLGRQLELITSKTGARAATIRVAEENGKLKLRVKPILDSNDSDRASH